MTNSLENTLRNLPMEPGVYKFFDAQGKIIYIGKAKRLRNRVGSYFLKQASHTRKTQRLVSEIAAIEYTVVNSEVDALLLENNLIKENKPKYNILLKDDKTYPYIAVTSERFPRVFSTRNLSDKRCRYFGPYANVRTMNVLLELFGKLFHLRTCSYALTEESVAAGKFKVCLEYHIKNCLGPCEALQPEAEYNEEVEQVVQILKGKLSVPLQYYRQKMQQAAEALAFEQAAVYKQKLDLLAGYQAKSLVAPVQVEELEVYAITADERFAYVNFMKITDGAMTHTESVQLRRRAEDEESDILREAIADFRARYRSASRRIVANIDVPELSEELEAELTVPKIGDLRKLVELSLKNAFYYKKERDLARGELSEKKTQNSAMMQLKADLNLPTLPRHIECFDNSNFHGTDAVSACVVFRDGKPSKRDYRHFNVKTVVGADDFATMKEVVGRRYRRLLDEEQPLPDLVVIDGGKGQLGAAVEALQELGIYGRLPIVGIAKRLEEIYFPADPVPLHISKKSRSMHLLQHMRDEAHRFGIGHHRDRRSKSSLKGALSDIPGIGPSTQQKLLDAFRSVENIRKASVEELAAVVGPAKAHVVKETLGE